MSFQPVIPTGGQAGWAFLQRTREAQQTAFETSPRIQRDLDYFRENIAKVKTADDLMADRRLLRVALGAFGLDEDINSTFFIKKVLEEGTLDDKSLANRLSDGRYKAMSKAFGFDVEPPHTQLPTFADTTLAAYKERQFEIAVGNESSDMRLALGFERDLGALAKRDLSVDGMWFEIMATPPVRQVFEKAFSLPTAVGTLDIDRQLEIFKEKSQAFFGTESPAEFTAPEKREELTRRFLISSELNATGGSYSSASVALTLLQSSGPPRF